jgi:CRISPR-associated endonuclease/helicase Cas3
MPEQGSPPQAEHREPSLEAGPVRPATLPLADALAHLSEDGRPHLLRDHLAAVGELAASFASRFGSAEWARLAGRWHDLGKYSAAFQARIRTANGFEAHIEGADSTERDHSSAGAVHALEKLGKAAAPLAFVIAGHHAGLSDRSRLLQERLPNKKHLLTEVSGKAPPDLLDGALPSPPLSVANSPEARRALELWTRLLFSALCDADFLDTERFYSDERAQLRGSGLPIGELRRLVERHLDAVEASAAPSPVNQVRAEVRAACKAAAAQPPGVFSLTVPTGGGKTLASLNFALAHAEAHGLQRVVVAIPFTSIIEQTAEVFGRALGDRDSVLEHHSNLDPDRETPRSRVATENWDAPVVVTTTVQLLESLLANRTSRCRKLHRLARSVIVLDEAQALRLAALAPAVDALHGLVRGFGATVVICTATQPAWHRSAALPVGFEQIREIVPPGIRAFERLRRVTVRWPEAPEPLPFEELAGRICGEQDVLAIVHRRKDARDLCLAIDQRLGAPSAFHLSALMCAEHRSQVLREVKRLKAAGEPVRMVATQLVEAGVDLDFAIVYRAMAGLDALAQAAGRCNREGRRPTGELRVFMAPTAPPPGVLSSGLAVARQMVAVNPGLDLFSPSTHRDYFSQLLRVQDLDADGVQAQREQLNFQQVASLFRLIEDDWSASVVVPWGEGLARVEELRRFGASRLRLRRLQRFLVQVPKKTLEAWLSGGAAERVEEIAVLKAVHAAAYHPRFGLIPQAVVSGTDSEG